MTLSSLEQTSPKWLAAVQRSLTSIASVRNHGDWHHAAVGAHDRHCLERLLFDAQ